MKPKLFRQSELVTGTITRRWEDLPDDALISTFYLVKITGVNPKTIQRHAAAGLLRSSIHITKRDAEKWLRAVEQRGGIRRGRPRKK